NLLASGNVQVTTASSATGAPNGGSITVANAVNWGTSNTLTLNASTFININAAISGGSGSTLELMEGTGISQGSGATISVPNVSAISSAGSITLTEANSIGT